MSSTRQLEQSYKNAMLSRHLLLTPSTDMVTVPSHMAFRSPNKDHTNSRVKIDTFL